MALRTPALLFGLLLIYDPNFSFAATGGRVGGGLFPSSGKSPSSKSSQSHSSSHSPPRSHSSIQPSHYSSLLPPTFARSPLHAPPIPPSTMTRSPSSSSDNLSGFMTFLAIAVGLAFYRYWTMARRTTTVFKFQVGLLGTAVSLQKDLNQITETADTSTSTGLSYVLTETTTSLLRNLDHCISSYTSVAQKYEIEEAEDFFRQLSTEEMAKFDEETLVNVNNMKTSSRGQSSHELHREYMVVTILVAAQGIHKVPTINGSGDLKKALQNLGSIPSREIVAVEILWTPQQENDTLTEKELLKGYPDLRGFYEEASEEEGPYEEQQPFLGASVVRNSEQVLGDGPYSQVCLLGTGRTLQRNLSQITQAADTDSFRGLSWVLKETTIALIRHLDHCIAGYSVVTPKFGLRDAKAYLNQLSWEERLTFDEETLVNVNNMKTQSLANQRANGFHNQYIVVTILLAIRCKYTLPSINSSAELKEALLKLSSLEDLWGVEVLWTPQSEANTLLEEELLKRYPLFNYF